MKTKIADKSHITIEQCEKLLLSSIIIDNDKIVQVQSIIEPKMLSLEPHKKIYDIMLSLYSRKTVIESSTLWNEIVAKGLNNTFLTKGDIDYIANGCNVLVSGNGAESYATRIANDYVKREAIKILSENIEKISEKNCDRKEILERVGKTLSKVLSLNCGDSTIEQAGIDPNELLSLINEKLDYDGFKTTGFRTGLKRLDEAVDGFKRQCLCTIGAGNKVGKTRWLMQIALINAVLGYNVFIASLEMSRKQLSIILACMLSGIDSFVFKNPQSWIKRQIYEGRFKTKEEALQFLKTEIVKAEELLKTLPIYIYEDYSASITNLNTELSKFSLQVGNPDIIMLDHAELMVNQSGENEFTSGFYRLYVTSKNLAKKYNAAFIIINQFTNEVKNNKDYRGELHNFKGGGASRDNCDLMLTMYRADLYQTLIEEKPELRGVCDITVELIRDGEKPMYRIPYEFTANGIKDKDYNGISGEELNLEEIG